MNYIGVTASGIGVIRDGGLPAAPLAGSPNSTRQPGLTLTNLQRLLAEQGQRYGHGEQPPVPVTQLPYSGPPLRYLLNGRQVTFCTTGEEVIYHYQTVPAGRYWPVPEYAASLQGASGASGIVRARINTTGQAPSAIIRPVADRLGLQVRPLRGPGAVAMHAMGTAMPLEVLSQPLTIQLLSGPGTVAMTLTLPVVVVTPSHAEPGKEMYELQLGLFDFCEAVEIEQVPLWASQFTDRASGHRCAVPVVAPKPLNIMLQALGSSTFHITQETYEEVIELTMARQAVMARRAAAAAAADEAEAADGSASAQAPAQAAAEAMQQARHIGVATTAAAPSAAAALPAAAAAPPAGTREWIDEWAPQPVQRRQQQRGHGSQRSGRRGRGRGRGSNPRQRQGQSAQQDTADVTSEATELNTVVDAGAAAGATTGVYAGLDPLPPGLVACLWAEVAATSLPRGDEACSICIEDFTDQLEDGSARRVTQLRCRHTFCVLCLRQFITNRTFQRRPLQCPQCRTEVEPR